MMVIADTTNNKMNICLLFECSSKYRESDMINVAIPAREKVRSKAPVNKKEEITKTLVPIRFASWRYTPSTMAWLHHRARVFALPASELMRKKGGNPISCWDKVIGPTDSDCINEPSCLDVVPKTYNTSPIAASSKPNAHMPNERRMKVSAGLVSDHAKSATSSDGTQIIKDL